MFFSMSLCREVKGGWEITFHYSFVLAFNAGQIIGGCWVVINDSMIIPTGSCLCLVRGQQHKNNGNRTWNHILHKVTCHHHRFLHQEVFFSSVSQAYPFQKRFSIIFHLRRSRAVTSSTELVISLIPLIFLDILAAGLERMVRATWCGGRPSGRPCRRGGRG